jgi:hypothetical protein
MKDYWEMSMASILGVLPLLWIQTRQLPQVIKKFGRSLIRKSRN